ncbi:PTS sugar transporter subunit IIC [Gemmatimonas sp.]|uniref:PTS sugar transporter subunit IIC n=1 Tax=Gemmatimonas sp. TaxID=1962908 RepID=UPI003983257F
MNGSTWWLDVLPLSLLAGVIGLDVVSFPQAMISRPIVAATLGGAFVGAPFAGLVCGAALECLALEALPVGASRYPEWGSASVVAGAVAATGATAGGPAGGPAGAMPLAGAFVVAVALGIATAWIGGLTMIKHRQIIARFARPRLGQLAAGNRNTVVGLQVFGMTLDLVRAALLGAVCFIPGHLLAVQVNGRWSVPEDLSRAIVVTCVAAVAAASVWKDFHAISGTRRLFLISLAVGTLMVVLGA